MWADTALIRRGMQTNDVSEALVDRPPSTLRRTGGVLMGRLTLFGILLLMTVSAIGQGVAYVTGLVLPDALASTVAICAILLSTPSMIDDRLYAAWPKTVLLMAALVVYYVVQFIWSGGSVAALSVLTQVGLSLCFLLVGLSRQRGTTRMQHQAVIVCALLLWAGLALMMLVVGVYSITAPKNIVGGIMMYLALIIGIERIRTRGGTAPLYQACILVIAGGLVTGHRLSTIVGLLGMFIVVMTVQRRGRIARWMVLYSAAFLASFSIYMYLNYQNLGWFGDFNMLFQEYSGRQILSGRQSIWNEIIRYTVERDPIFGTGLETNERDFLGSALAASSSFILMFLQTGWLGIILMVLLLLAVSMESLRTSNRIAGTAATLMTFSVVLHASYETVLIQNNFRISVLLWLAVGLAGAATRSDQLTAVSTPNARQRLSRWTQRTGRA